MADFGLTRLSRVFFGLLTPVALMRQLVTHLELGFNPANFIIAKAGKPMARLSPLSAPVREKHLGLLKGRIKVPDDFNSPLDEEILSTFEGR